jgi:hypothetical protein
MEGHKPFYLDMFWNPARQCTGPQCKFKGAGKATAWHTAGLCLNCCWTQWNQQQVVRTKTLTIRENHIPPLVSCTRDQEIMSATKGYDTARRTPFSTRLGHITSSPPCALLWLGEKVVDMHTRVSSVGW